jgi:hypothetical protein
LVTERTKKSEKTDQKSDSPPPFGEESLLPPLLSLSRRQFDEEI